jgi:hypothetical protein
MPYVGHMITLSDCFHVTIKLNGQTVIAGDMPHWTASDVHTVTPDDFIEEASDWMTPADKTMTIIIRAGNVTVRTMELTL